MNLIVIDRAEYRRWCLLACVPNFRFILCIFAVILMWKDILNLTHILFIHLFLLFLSSEKMKSKQIIGIENNKCTNTEISPLNNIFQSKQKQTNKNSNEIPTFIEQQFE